MKKRKVSKKFTRSSSKFSKLVVSGHVKAGYVFYGLNSTAAEIKNGTAPKFIATGSVNPQKTLQYNGVVTSATEAAKLAPHAFPNGEAKDVLKSYQLSNGKTLFEIKSIPSFPSEPWRF